LIYQIVNKSHFGLLSLGQVFFIRFFKVLTISFEIWIFVEEINPFILNSKFFTFEDRIDVKSSDNEISNGKIISTKVCVGT